jgi:hypothetical protein
MARAIPLNLVNVEARKRSASESAYTTVPNAREMQILHDLFIKHEAASTPEQRRQFVYPSNTRHEATRFMHPQVCTWHTTRCGGG